MKTEDLVSTLSGLSELELVKIFYSAFSSRKTIIGEEIDDAYVIGNAGFSPVDGAALVYVSALALESSAEASELIQNGFCDKCKIHIQCSSKDATCPICSSTVDCT